MRKLKRRREGQTLAEFGLTLPILLLLVFGVVEFGRMFQAWVTIQNSAREATRYTTTGQYDEEKYTIDSLLNCYQEDDVDSPGQRFAYPGNVDVTVFGHQVEPGVYEVTGESMFASWYDGQDCDPGRPEHLEMRKDILRLASIYDTARRGAAGLSLEDTIQDGSLDGLTDMLFGNFHAEPPRSDERGYFMVTVCSSRTMLDELSEPLHEEHPRNRFVMIEDEDMLPLGYSYDYAPPFCMHNEIPPDADPSDPSDDPVNNSGQRWMDPGGPGDRIDVLVVFNHPLITPLPFTEGYLRITARRSGVNETFRTSRALNAVQGSPPGTGGQERPTPLPPTNTPTATPTNTPTATGTQTNTPTFTPTPEPFTCDNLEFSDIRFVGNQVYVNIQNFNLEPSELQWIELSWRRPDGWTGMFLQSAAIDTSMGGTEAHWFGNRPDAPFILGNPNHPDPMFAKPDSDLTQDEIDDWVDAGRFIPGEGAVSSWVGTYQNLPTGQLGYSLANPEGLNQFDFAGSQWAFSNPATGGLCFVRAPIPDPDNPPTEPVIDPDASDTFTPDCASSLITVEFNRFDLGGVVVLTVTNNRHQPSPFMGFDFYWPDHDDLPKVVSDQLLGLERVTVGGSNVDHPNAILVWEGDRDGDGNRIPDYESGTNSYNEGTWFDGYTFPPLSVTNMYMDFSGTGSTLEDSFDVGPWMFSGAFDIDCYITGGSGGNGGGDNPSGTINLGAPPPPPPTNTPRPTNTPGPTYTPSPTRPTSTPSNTPTPGPTKTFTLTPEPTATTEEVPPDAPTDPNSGPGAG